MYNANENRTKSLSPVLQSCMQNSHSMLLLAQDRLQQRAGVCVDS